MPAVATERLHRGISCWFGVLLVALPLTWLSSMLSALGNLLEVCHDLERCGSVSALEEPLIPTSSAANGRTAAQCGARRRWSARRSTTPTSFPRLKAALICSGPSAWERIGVPSSGSSSVA